MSDVFFIGWSGKTGPALGRFLAIVAVAVVVGLGALGWMLGAGLDDPSDGLIGLAPKPSVAPLAPEGRVAQGVLEAGPSALLRLDPTPDHPQGETLLMAGYGKTGVAVDPALLGQRVEARGTVFRRGDISMLITDGKFAPVAGPVTAPSVEPLGRWRIAGEICDGKCYAGIMRPGSGLSHRACAALCFMGEVPLVFVAPEPVAGSAFFILADADGSAPPDLARRFIGIPVRLEGDLERRGSALVFRVDFRKAARL